MIGIRPSQYPVNRSERPTFRCGLQSCWSRLSDEVRCPDFETAGGVAESRRNFTLEDVHVEGTERITEAAAKYDVDRYIHVSSHSANPQSPSEFYATKVRIVSGSSHLRG